VIGDVIPRPDRRLRGCLAIVMTNIAVALVALGAHWLITPVTQTQKQDSTFERQKPQVSDWPPHNHDNESPQA
jgi:hypothetical protein